MESRVEGDPEVLDDDDVTHVTVCPSCLARARAFALPQMRGVTVTTIAVTDTHGVATYTVMARKGHKVLSTAQGPTQEDALFDALQKLGVLA